MIWYEYVKSRSKISLQWIEDETMAVIPDPWFSVSVCFGAEAQTFRAPKQSDDRLLIFPLSQRGSS